MGKWIDRTAITALAALALYLLFLQAFGSITAACILSFACSFMLIRLRLRRGGGYRLTRIQAEAILQKWAYGDDSEARSRISRLTGYPEDELVYLAKHPAASVGMGDIFSAWKSKRGSSRITVASPCYADGRARAFAKTLTAPSVELCDPAKLIPLIRKSGLDAPDTLRGRACITRAKNLLRELPYRRPWPKNLLTGLLLMIVYLLTGNSAYLILSAGMLLLAGVAIRPWA